MTEYALAANPHKNYYPQRTKSIQFIGLHVTAGLQDLDLLGIDHSAASTNQYGATTATQASWHCCVDSDSIEPALPDEAVAWHIRNYNSNSLGLEICNADARWDNKPDEWIEATLRNAAKVCAAWEKKYTIPRRLLSKAQIDQGLKGYSYHMFLDPSRRHDPGATFPVQRFFDLIGEVSGEVSVNPKPTPPPAPKPSVKPNCTALQTALHISADNLWGSDTDKAFNAVIQASDNNFPYGVAYAQRVVGTKDDGQWGPNSKTALKATVLELQKSFSRMGFAVGGVDGVWGSKTQAAFTKARQACHI